MTALVAFLAVPCTLWVHGQVHRRLATAPETLLHSLECGDDNLRELVEDCMPSRTDSTSFWVGCKWDIYGLCQTSLMFTLRNARRILFSTVRHERRLHVLSDGGTIGLDFAFLSSAKRSAQLESYPADKPVVIMSHGMLGDATSEYLIFLTEKLLLLEFIVIVIVSRGNGNLSLTSTKSFHWFDTSDYHEALLYLRTEHFRCNPFVTVGFSLGAGLMLKYMSQDHLHKQVSVDLAVCISPPWDIKKKSPYFSFWSCLLVVPLKLFILRHYAMLKRKDISLWQILSTFNLEEWDELFCRAYGMKDVEEYYSLGSAITTAHLITTPTISISAIDDAICSIEGKPTAPPNNLALVTSHYGGHLGFPDSSLLQSWVDDFVVRLVLRRASQINNRLTI